MDPKEHYVLFGHNEGRAYKRPLRKTDVVHILSRFFNLQHYLELCTPSTGLCYADIQKDQLTECKRLMYLAPFSFDDGMTIDFRSPDESIDGALEAFAESGSVVDICLVDGWHTYPAASRDIARMYDILQDGGILVVHDCLPPNRKTANPSFRQGNWCGVSYKAFLDFVLTEPSADYLTINSDYGCGLIIKNRTFEGVLHTKSRTYRIPERPRAVLRTEFLDAGNNADNAYDVFDKYRHELLRLIEPEQLESAFK